MLTSGLSVCTWAEGPDPDPDPDLEKDRWWTSWTRDADKDRLDDELEFQLDGVAPHVQIKVFVDYDHRPNERDIERLMDLDAGIYYRCRYIDTVIIEIEAGSVHSILDLPGVVMLEADPVIEKALNSASRSVDLDVVKGNWSYSGDGVVIAIIDTGLDVNHTGLDDLDDINETYDPKVIAFYDAKHQPDKIDGTLGAYDDDGHGSHVGGIASGTGDGSENYKYQGVAQSTKLVGIKVMGPSDNTMSDAMRGLEWARDNKDKYDISILSISFGAIFSGGLTNDGNSAISRLCDDLVQYGFVVVVAGGNSGPRPKTIAPPGDAKQVITVGNVNDDHSLNPSSSRGPVGSWNDNYIKPDICAPGTNIYSVAYNTNDNYTEKTGTSMSAPFVSGLVAIMLEIDGSLTPTQVKTMLQNTAGGEMMSPFQGSPNNDFGYGIIRPFEMINNLTGGVKPPKVMMDKLDLLVNGMITISGRAESEFGPILRVEVQTGTGGWDMTEGTANWEYEWDTTIRSNGQVEIRARSYDGNLYSIVQRRIVTINNLVVETSLPEFAEFSGNSTIKGSARGLIIEKVEVRTDQGLWEVAEDTSIDGDWSTWKYDFDSRDLSDGKHTFRARAFDGYSYTQSKEYIIRIANKKDGSDGFLPSFEAVMLLGALALVLVIRTRGRGRRT